MALKPPPVQEPIMRVGGNLSQVWHLWFQDLFKNQISHSELQNLSADDHAQYHNDDRALTWLGTRTTDDLPEGLTNLYDQGGLTTTVFETSASVTLDDNYFQWNFDTSSSNLVATLPIGVDNRQYKIVNVGSGKLTINPSGSNTLLGENNSFDIFSNESLIVAYKAASGWQ